MGATDLLLEHKANGKSRRLVRASQRAELFLIGSSPASNLRLLGTGVEGCHAALRRTAEGWTVCHLGGADRLSVDGQPVLERALEIGRAHVIQIGDHTVTVTARARGNSLFDESRKPEAIGSGSADQLHQVVIRNRAGKVVGVHLLAKGHAFRLHDGLAERLLPAPTSGDWVTTTVGNRRVQQRLIESQEAAVADGFQLDHGLKKPLLAVVALFLLLGLFGLLFGGGKTTEAVLDTKSKDMIYSAKTVKMKRDESKRIVKSRAKDSQSTAAASAPKAPSTAPDEATAPKSTARASHALASLRASGLRALVGKIAARASKQGILIASIGVSPDTKGAGRAFFSQGTATIGGGGAAKGGTAFRLGGIATTGIGGGSAGAAKAGTGLASGNVGTGDVALVDEETVIEGGLDRDVIADVIKRNLGQIRYCYERQLSSNPDLYGKVMVKFTIDAAGTVGDPKIDGSTMKSAMVEGCILRRLAGWKFPLPKGGTQVKVSYPFLFKAL